MDEQHPIRITLALAGALASAGLVLPEPANVAAFLGSLGLGLGIGLGAVIERVGRAKAKAYKEWDDVHRESSMAKLEEATRRHEETVGQVELNSRQILALQQKLESEREVNEKLRRDLQDFAVSVLRERGYIAHHDQTEATR